jgi:hypothetical protein
MWDNYIEILNTLRIKAFTIEECKNHVFKIGSFYLCVGCTSVFIGIIIANIFVFSLFEFFKNNPLVLALITSFGVLIALLQLLIKPKNK